MVVVSPERITSSSNPLLKRVRRAAARGALTDDGCLIAESLHLLEEALRGNLEVRAVLVAASAQRTVERLVGRTREARLIIVDDALLQKTATTESSQGVIALVRPPVWDLDAVFRGCCLAVALDGVQDPGNAGTIGRSTEAFGGTGVLFLSGSVSPYNPKVLRAAAGSLFRIPFAQRLDAASAMAEFRRRGIQVLAASQRAEAEPSTYDFNRPTVLLIGSESRGLSTTLATNAQGVRIPTTGVESLNAATAAGVLLYEAARCRAQHATGGTGRK